MSALPFCRAGGVKKAIVTVGSGAERSSSSYSIVFSPYGSGQAAMHSAQPLQS